MDTYRKTPGNTEKILPFTEVGSETWGEKGDDLHTTIDTQVNGHMDYHESGE